jgi:hypothetical protein
MDFDFETKRRTATKNGPQAHVKKPDSHHRSFTNDISSGSNKFINDLR